MSRSHVRSFGVAARIVGFTSLCLGIGACADTVDGTAGDANENGSQPDPGDVEPAPPPPVITNIAPLAGHYGTEVTITGDNFEGATLSLGAGAEPIVVPQFPDDTKGTAPKPPKLVTSWSKTEIKFKYPFPAEGAIRVTSSSGTAEGGAFVPSWTPGRPVAGAFARRTLLAVVAPAAGTVVAAFDGETGPVLLVARPNGAVETRAFDRGPTALTTMSLYATPTGSVDGFFAAEGKLWRLTDALGAATTTNTGVAAELAAGAQDTTGPYAWLKNGTSLTMVRPPSWAAVSTVTDPTPSLTAPGQSLAVGTDHSLVVGWGKNSSGSFPLYDHTASAQARRLPAGLTVFDAQKTVGGGVDDYMVWTRFWAGPEGRLSSYFCANDTGLFAASGLNCREGYVGSGTTTPTTVSQYLVGYNATTSVVAACETASGKVKLGPETSTAAQVDTIFPCPTILAVGVDPVGAGQMLVVGSDKQLYAPRKR